MTLYRYLLEIALLNAALGGLLIPVVWCVSRCFRSPAVASLLWTIVLLKLLTPPCFFVAVAIKPGNDQQTLEHQPAQKSVISEKTERGDGIVANDLPATVHHSSTDQLESKEANRDARSSLESVNQRLKDEHRNRTVVADQTIDRRADAMRPGWTFVWSWSLVINVASGIWICGSLFLASLTIFRLYRFRYLVQNSQNAAESILDDVQEVATIAGLRSIPQIKVVGRRVSPSVGCWGLQPTLILPREFYASLNTIERRSLIAHELAHVLRRDHWRAWLEVIVMIVFWWYPLAWHACRQCRRATERCCDDWVLKWFPNNAEDYAETLLKSVDFVSTVGQGMPGIIHGIGEFATMKKRIVTILNTRHEPSLPKPLKHVLGLMAIAVLAVGVQFVRLTDRKISRDAWAEERLPERQRIVDVPSPLLKPGDLVFVMQPSIVYGKKDVVWTLPRGTSLEIEKIKESTLTVKEPEQGTGDAEGSIDRQNVASTAQALEKFTQQIHQNPDDAGAFAARGNVYRHEREIDLAIDDFNEAIRLNPHDAVTFLKRGMTWTMDDSDRKIADFTEAIRLDPQLITAYKRRLGVFIIQLDGERGSADCEDILRLHPHDASAIAWQTMLNVLKNTQKKNDNLIEKLSHAIQLKPADPELYLKRAEAYREIRMKPGPQLHFHQLETNKQRERIDKAIVDYTSAIRLDANLEKAWRGRGEIWFERHEYDLAVADYSAAIAADPRNVKAIYRRGLAWNEKGEFDKAITDFSEAIRLEPKHSEAYKHRGYAWEQIENDDRAIEDYTKTIGMNPTQIGFGIGFSMRNDVKFKSEFGAERYAFLYGHRGALFAKRFEFEKALADFEDALRKNPRAFPRAG
jgi:beta-lactamase regulating signal transducer with metallopeptidase domain/tetratricopeptide (TPR) repeat protein